MADNREKVLQSLIKAQERYQTLLNMQEKSGNDYSAALEKQNERVKKLGSQLKGLNQSNQKFVGDLEKGISSISSSFSSFKDAQTQVVLNAKSLTNVSGYQKELIDSILSDTRDLAELNSNDSEQLLAKAEALQLQLGIAQAIFGVDSDIAQSLAAQVERAKEIASLSEDERAALDAQAEASKKLKQITQGISENIQTAVAKLFSFKGAMGGILVGAGKLWKNFSEVNKQLGQVGDYTDGAAFNASLMSFAFSDSAGTLKALSAEMGGTEDATFGAQLQTNLMANNLGISNTEAATLSGSLARLNNGSLETAGNLADSARDLARMNNIPVSQLMGDVAGSAEQFALFGREGGKNILQAAGYAAKLGTNMATLSGIADNLLDFESSITKELELGAMLGRNINLNKARELAYAGDIEGATKATLAELGGIEEFNKMDYFQKKQTADLLGVSVAELQKMATNQEKAANISKLMNGDFSNMGESIKALAAEFGPKMLDWGGKFLMLSSQAGQTWTAFGGTLKGIGSKLGGIFKKGGGAASAAATMKPDTSVADNLNKTAGSKGPKAGNLLKGAAAILILSAALFIAAKAFQEFGSVTWPAVGMGLASLVGLAGIAYVLGKAQGEMIKGAIAVAILGAALIPFAFSMSLIAGLDINSVIAAAAGLVIFSAAIFGLGALMMSGVGAVVFGAGLLALVGLGVSMMALGAGLLVAAAGFQAIGGSMGGVISLIAQIKDVLGGMFEHIAPISALALSLVGLAGALTLVGIAGIAALPGLMAVAAVGTIAMGVGSLLGFGGEGGEGGDSALLEEIRGLRADLNDGKVGVYMDGQKVTAAISRVVSKVGNNSYAQ